jgi:hypothetical protein
MDGAIDGSILGATDEVKDGAIDGSILGATDGVKDGAIDGLILGAIDGVKDGAIDGLILGATDGVKDGAIDGSILGVSERGSELHVDRPEPTQAGYTQAGVKEKVSTPNVIPLQYSIIAILRLLQLRNTSGPIDVTLLGITTEASESQLRNALGPIDVTLLGIVTDFRDMHP